MSHTYWVVLIDYWMSAMRCNTIHKIWVLGCEHSRVLISSLSFVSVYNWCRDKMKCIWNYIRKACLYRSYSINMSSPHHNSFDGSVIMCVSMWYPFICYVNYPLLETVFCVSKNAVQSLWNYDIQHNTKKTTQSIGENVEKIDILKRYVAKVCGLS